MSFQEARDTRTESRTLVNYSMVQKLTPCMGMLVEGSEGGLISQRITIELDPIPGRLMTPITGEVCAVFVPIQAIDALLDPAAAYAGMTEVVRQKLLSGNPLFVVEDETEISQRCGINPKSVAGFKKTNRMVRVAHNVAVNFLRRRIHKDAVQLISTNTAITPALLGSTVLTRLNGVLDPDERINGAVALRIPQMILPVEGITQSAGQIATAQGVSMTSSATDITLGALNNPNLRFKRNVGNPVGTDLDITATLNAVTAGNVSLTDFYNAETMDRLTRTMGQIMDANPEYGQDMILRWAHGLSMENGDDPVLLAHQTAYFGMQIIGATDSPGVRNETIRSDMALEFRLNIPIPKTELGGVIITFVSVKPDETIASQPHPVLANNFNLRNHMADQLALAQKAPGQILRLRQHERAVAVGECGEPITPLFLAPE